MRSWRCKVCTSWITATPTAAKTNKGCIFSINPSDLGFLHQPESFGQRPVRRAVTGRLGNCSLWLKSISAGFPATQNIDAGPTERFDFTCGLSPEQKAWLFALQNIAMADEHWELCETIAAAVVHPAFFGRSWRGFQFGN